MRVAIVTGGAGGLGLAAAKAMGQSYHVVLAGRNPDALRRTVADLTKAEVSASAQQCDVSNRREVDLLFDAAQTIGRISAVINSAGLSPLMAAPGTIVRTNASGTINVTEASLRVAAEGMALVNVSSMAAYMMPSAFTPRRTFGLALKDPDRFERALNGWINRYPRSLRSNMAYIASKSFVVWYSQRMASRFGQKGSRLLSVSPGTFDTSMGRLEEASGSGLLVERSALARFGEPREMGDLLAFCAGEKASYLTGVDILADGGTVAGLTFRHLLQVAWFQHQQMRVARNQR